jgi:DNA mismatch endonuclease, patch repair protein
VNVDTLSAAERSDRMSRIRGANTTPELWVRRFLHAKGFRYRLHVRDLPGRPDIVLPKHGVVIMVHGCFWHAHKCQKGRIPATRSSFWRLKFEGNRARDIRNVRKLRCMGWRVLTVWECSLATPSKRNRTLAKLQKRIEAQNAIERMGKA